MLQPIIEGETAHFFEEIKVFYLSKDNRGPIRAYSVHLSLSAAFHINTQISTPQIVTKM